MDYGDSDFLADNDRSIRDFRENEKASKQHIVKQMVKLRHNLQYNKHLLSVYLKAKTIFDEMVEEHRAQIHHLDEIYRHLSKLIHTELTRHKSSKKRRDDGGGGGVMDNKPMIKELVKDKRKIGKLLSNMRKGLDKLMEIDTIIGTTVDKINEIQFIEDNDGADEDDEDDEDEASEEDDDEEDSDESDDDDDEEAEASEEDAEDSASDAEEEEEDDDDDEVDEDSASEEDDAEEEDDDEGAEDSEAEASEEDDAEEDDAEEDEEPVVFY